MLNHANTKFLKLAVYPLLKKDMFILFRLFFRGVIDNTKLGTAESDDSALTKTGVKTLVTLSL